MCEKVFPRYDDRRRHCKNIHQCTIPKRRKGRQPERRRDCEYDPEDTSYDVESEYNPETIDHQGSNMRCNAMSISSPHPSVASDHRGRSRERKQGKRQRSSRSESQMGSVEEVDSPPEQMSTHRISCAASDNLRPSMYMHGAIPLEQYVTIKAAVKVALERHDAYRII